MAIGKITGEALEELGKISTRVSPRPDLTELSTQSPSEWEAVSNVFSRRSGIPDIAQAENVAAIRKRAADEARLSQYIDEVYKGMDTNASEELKELIAQGQNANFGIGRWTPETDLSLMPIQNSAKQGYKTFRALNDLDYVVTDENIRANMEKEGFKGTTSGLIAKEVDSDIVKTTDFANMEIRVADSKGKRLNSANISGEDLIKNYIDKGYKLYEVHPYTRANQELNYNYILDKDTTKYNKPIAPGVLNYAEGGIRDYQKGEYFVRQGHVMNGDGKTYWYSKTVTSGDDYNRVQQYADELNQALDMWNRAKGNLADLQTMLDEVDFKEFKVRTASDLNDMVRTSTNTTGDFDPNFKVGVYKSGEYPLNDSGLPDLHTSSSMDTAKVDLMKLSSRYYRGRGHILNNINNDLSHLAKPEDILEKLVRRVAFGRNIEPLLETQGEHFKRMFSDVIRAPEGVSAEALSGKQMLLFGETKSLSEVGRGAKNKIKAARHMQQVMRNVAGIPTTTDKKIIEYINDFLDTLGVKLERWWDPKHLDKLKNTNPIRFAQSLVFSMLLGIFNPAQLWKQGMQILNLMSTYLPDTLKSLAQLSVILPAYATRKSGSDILNGFKHFAGKIEGFSPAELDLMIEYMERYGTFHQASNRPEIVGTNMFLKNLNNFKKLNMIFFTTGTNFSNLVCDVLAFNLLKKNQTYSKYFADLENGIQKLDKEKFFREIAFVSDGLNFNQTKANASGIQTNPITAIFVGLQTYSMGAIGAVFGKNLSRVEKAVTAAGGGGKKINIPARLKLIAAFLAMWGIGGTFDRDSVPWLYNQMTAWGIPDDIQNIVAEGWLTEALAKQGYDVREGPDMLSAYKSLWSVVEAFLNRDGGAPDMPMTNMMPMIGAMYQSIKDTVAPTTSEADVIGWLQMVNSKPLPSAIKNTTASLLGFFTAKYYDKYGRILKDNLTWSDSALLAFGVRPVEAKNFATARARDKLYRDAVDECIEGYIKPILDQEASYIGTNLDSPSSAEAIGTLHNERDRAIAACSKMIEDNMPSMYHKYFDNKMMSLMKSNPDPISGMSKYQRALYWRITGNR